MSEISVPQKKTILVVEDEESLRMAISLVLKSSGFRVLQAGNGKEAFEIIQIEKPDAIVSDIRMPNEDGIALLQKVRILDWKKPVFFFVSGYTDLKDEDAYDLGADAIFPKPFDREAFLRELRSKLGTLSERLQRENETAPHLPLLALRQADIKIGRGGFFMATEKDFLKVGSRVNLSIQTLNTEKLEGTGVVRWVRDVPADQLPVGCGIEFTNIKNSSLDSLIKFIEDNKSKSYIPKGLS